MRARASTFDRIVCGKIIHRSFHGSLYAFSNSENREQSGLREPVRRPLFELSFRITVAWFIEWSYLSLYSETGLISVLSRIYR